MPEDLCDLLRSADEAEATGDVETSLRLLRLAASRPEASADCWYRLGRILADLGHVPEALKSLEGALYRDPAHLESLDLLAELAAANDAHDLALQALEAASRANVPDAVLRPLRAALHRSANQPPPAADILPEPPDLEILPEDADLVRFMAFFGGREDVYARQWYSSAKDRGGYSPVHEPLTPSVLRRHFLGEVTLGVYPVRLDGTCVFAALDLDIPSSVLDAARADSTLARRLATRLQQGAAEARRILADLGFTVIVEDSGYKGRHLWLPFDSPVPARILRDLCERVSAALGAVVDRDLFTIEYFPKQAETRGKGLGNLIKLPLGIHRRSGRRSAFLDADMTPIRRPFTYLRALSRTPASSALAAIESLAQRLVPVGDEGLCQSPSAPDSETGEPSRDVADLLPAPPAPPPSWTEADFSTDPDVRHLLEACPVLADLVRQAIEHRTLSREALLVLRHTLGHFPKGLLAYNYVHDRAGGALQDRLVSVLRGNPISCARIRSRLPDTVARVPCACDFPFAEASYPHPVLHLSDPARPAPPPSAPPGGAVLDIESEVRRFTEIIRRIADLERDRDALARRLALALRSIPDGAMALPEGSLCLVLDSGLEVLEWRPASLEEHADPPARTLPTPLEAVPRFRIAMQQAAKSDPTARENGVSRPTLVAGITVKPLTPEQA